MVSRFVRTLSPLALVLISLASAGQAHSLPASTLRDVPYSFDAQRMSVAKDSFHFFRSFVGYFYLLAKENEPSLSILKKPAKSNLPTAVCMGDAHPENFGFLLQSTGARFFTANDIDDSEVAPAALDLFRFMVSARLHDPTISLGALLDAYDDGIENKPHEASSVIDELLAKSRSHSTEPRNGDIDQNKLIQPSQARALTTQEMTDIAAVVRTLSGGWKIIDTFATEKIGGGSGGMLRFEVLLSGAKSKLLHLEFKEETAASILPFVTAPLAITARLPRALDAIFDSKVDPIYQVVTITGRTMLVRPRYSANVGVNLDKNSPADNRDLIVYEAFTLGRLHSRTLSDSADWVRLLKAAPRADWESDTNTMVTFIERKFRSLP